jgi:hypothetical protein
MLRIDVMAFGKALLLESLRKSMPTEPLPTQRAVDDNNDSQLVVKPGSRKNEEVRSLLTRCLT